MIPKTITKRICEETKLVGYMEKAGIFLRPYKTDNRFLTGRCPSCGGNLLVCKDNELFKCFKCRAEGNVIDFCKLLNKCGYRKAVEMLSENIRNSEAFIEAGNVEQILNRKKDILLDINRMALNEFVNALGYSHSNAARDYFEKKRRLTPETISCFGLGYAVGGNTLYDKLSKKYDDDVLKESGLFVWKEDGSVHSRFWNRIMIPITDEWNNVIAFGGRVLDDSKPKYLNSPDTLLFNKRYQLFGLGQALAATNNRMLDNMIVCEGYMDVISMHQAGFTQTVASLGTALTPAQARLIKSHTKTVYTSYDMDGPGREANKRAVELLTKAGLKVYCLDLSPAKDPDEFIKLYGTRALGDRKSVV